MDNIGKEEKAEKILARKTEMAARVTQLKSDMADICQQPSGIRFFRYLRDVCGFHRSTIVVGKDSMEVNIQSTLNNEARRNIYMEVRQFLKRDKLIDIEYGDLK